MKKEIRPEQVQQAINIMWDYAFEDKDGSEIIHMSDVEAIINDILLGGR